MPDEVWFEREAANPAQPAGAYFWVLVLLAGGVATMFFGSGRLAFAAGALLAGAGAGLYAWLLHAAPACVYFRYCWLDGAGLHHIEGTDPGGRVAHFAWSEIERAEAADPDDEFRGIILYLRRTGLRGVPVMLSVEHRDEAVAAIRARLG
jgi:hypothetical protein